ncbi:hypothetical protein FOL47_002101, partial [Perkinsus chesapeaki]
DRTTAAAEALQTYIHTGPDSLRILAFLGGIAITSAGALTVLSVSEAFHHPVMYLLNAYQTLFGLVTCLLEADPKYLNKFGIQEKIREYFQLITELWGRGLFYLFQASIALMHFTLLHVIIGLYMAAIGLLTISLHFTRPVASTTERSEAVVTVGFDVHFPIAMTDSRRRYKSDAEVIAESGVLVRFVYHLYLQLPALLAFIRGHLACWAERGFTFRRTAITLGVIGRYIMALVMIGIFNNLGRRREGMYSAYSVFNRGGRHLLGDLRVDQLERELRGQGPAGAGADTDLLVPLGDPGATSFSSREANTVCPCGSGRKRKRCCGAGSGRLDKRVGRTVTTGGNEKCGESESIFEKVELERYGMRVLSEGFLD